MHIKRRTNVIKKLERNILTISLVKKFIFKNFLIYQRFKVKNKNIVAKYAKVMPSALGKKPVKKIEVNRKNSAVIIVIFLWSFGFPIA